MKLMTTLTALLFFSLTILFSVPVEAKPKDAAATAATRMAVPMDYPASRALEDMAFYITDLSNTEQSITELTEYVQTAASVLHTDSISVRASNGVINRQSPEWIAVRDAFRDAGYTVGTNNRTGVAQISW